LECAFQFGTSEIRAYQNGGCNNRSEQSKTAQFAHHEPPRRETDVLWRRVCEATYSDPKRREMEPNPRPTTQGFSKSLWDDRKDLQSTRGRLLQPGTYDDGNGSITVSALGSAWNPIFVTGDRQSALQQRRA
jgi:hypothetical protein